MRRFHLLILILPLLYAGIAKGDKVSLLAQLLKAENEDAAFDLARAESRRFGGRSSVLELCLADINERIELPRPAQRGLLRSLNYRFGLTEGDASTLRRALKANSTDVRTHWLPSLAELTDIDLNPLVLDRDASEIFIGMAPDEISTVLSRLNLEKMTDPDFTRLKHQVWPVPGLVEVLLGTDMKRAIRLLDGLPARHRRMSHLGKIFAFEALGSGVAFMGAVFSAPASTHWAVASVAAAASIPLTLAIGGGRIKKLKSQQTAVLAYLDAICDFLVHNQIELSADLKHDFFKMLDSLYGVLAAPDAATSTSDAVLHTLSRLKYLRPEIFGSDLSALENKIADLQMVGAVLDRDKSRPFQATRRPSTLCAYLLHHQDAVLVPLKP